MGMMPVGPYLVKEFKLGSADVVLRFGRFVGAHEKVLSEVSVIRRSDGEEQEDP